jgi:CheY-like chemotaxis protein
MQSYRVLIVDDQREVRRVLRAGLETLGHDIKVVDVPSGEEAILVLSRQPIDLLVADVRLPGISGLELKERAQVRNPALRFILITGMLDTKTRQAVANAGADAYFFKPVEMAPFTNAALACLGLDVEEEKASEPAPQGGSADNLTPATEAQPAPAVPPAAEPVTSGGRLAERLSGLRQETGAACAVLVNEAAQVIAQAGAWPDSANPTDLLSALRAVLNSGGKLPGMLGESLTQDWLCFSGQLYDFFLTSMSQAIGLVVITTHAPLLGKRVGDLVMAMHRAAQDLREILIDFGVGVTEPQRITLIQPVQEAEEVAALDESLLTALDDIFGSAKTGKLKTEEVDAFWESAIEDGARDVSSSDALTYEQARQLGLAPEEN